MSATTDEIKARIDLVDLIGRSVQLKRSGPASFKGLCPFHQEKTPSFYVNADRGTWNCFGCGKHGDAFSWLMEREHLEFGEALRTLAQLAGVELPSRDNPEQVEATKRLFEALGAAQSFYHAQLNGGLGVQARQYLAGRGFTSETIERFSLGYAAPGGGLLRYLKDLGYSDEEVVGSGAVSVGDDGHHFDFFRDRVLFPIRDAQGRTIAFGGRALDNSTPKYLNSRDTLLFHKQETLFAIDLALRSIRQQRQVVVVEGYVDAIMAHQHGYPNVVATLGTAVTERHLRLLARSADEIVLALDSDAAGQAATWRALQVADQGLRGGLTPLVGPDRRRRQLVEGRSARLKVLSLPGAKDPDELIRADPGAWPGLVAAAVPVVEFVIQHLAQRHNLADAAGKSAAAAEAAEVLLGISDPIEQAHYAQRVAEVLRVDEAAVQRAVLARRRGGRPRPASAQPPEAGVVGSDADGRGAVQHQHATPQAALDAYALALVLRLREVEGNTALHLSESAPNPNDLLLPEDQALLAHLLSDQPVEPLPPALAEPRARVEGQLPLAQRLPEHRLLPELRLTALQLRQRSLLAQRAEVSRMLHDGIPAEEQADWIGQLDALLSGLRQVDEALADARRQVR